MIGHVVLEICRNCKLDAYTWKTISIMFTLQHTKWRQQIQNFRAMTVQYWWAWWTFVLHKLVFNSTQISATFTHFTKILQQHQVWQTTQQVSAEAVHNRCLLRQCFLHGMTPHNCDVQKWIVLLFTLQWFTQFDDSSKISIILVLSTGIFLTSYEFSGWNS